MEVLELNVKSVVDFLFYDSFLEVMEIPADANDTVAEKKKSRVRGKPFRIVVIGTPDHHEAGYNDPNILLQKADFFSLTPKSWLTSNIVDAFAFIFNRKEEQASGQVTRFWFNTFPYTCLNLWEVEREKKLKLEQIIAQLEVDANNAEDDQVASALAKVEKAHQELSRIDLAKYGQQCRQSLNNWSAFYNPSLIQNADYIFVPVHKSDHFTVLVFNMKYKQIEDIDNRSDHKGFTRYGGTLIEFCNIFEEFLHGDSVCRKDCSRVHSWNQRTLMFPFRNNTNIHDCGLFAIKAMEHFTGKNEKDEAMKDLNFASARNLARCNLAYELAFSPYNKWLHTLRDSCVAWSKDKPALHLKQKFRKADEKKLYEARVKFQEEQEKLSKLSRLIEIDKKRKEDLHKSKMK